jgi:exosortase/archaeosortase family protein
VIAATASPPSTQLVRAGRIAGGVALGVVVYLALAPWLPSVEAWWVGHLVALMPGVRSVITDGPRFGLFRDDGTLADLLVTTSCSWSGGLALLAGVATATARDVRSGVRAVAIPGAVFGLVNLLRIVAVAVVLVVWRGDHVWTVHTVIGSAVTGLCGVLAVAWCVRTGRGRREQIDAPVVG